MNLFSWLMAQIYDSSLQEAEDKCLRQWRAELLGQLSGKVLEIGCGTGLNLAHYPSAVDNLILLEPDRNMRKKLLPKVSHGTTQILDCSAEKIPLPDACCDAVVSTFVLCSVNNQSNVLAEIHRILRPQGQLIFIEHVAASNNPARLKWQQRLEPIWKKLNCGCRLTCDTENAIQQAGFTFSTLTQQSIRGVFPIVRPSIKGIAVK